MQNEFGTAPRGAAAIFNSAVGAWAIGAAWELGVLDELRAARKLDAAAFAADRGLAPGALAGMFRALAAVGVVDRADTVVTPAENFDEVLRNRSFFHWLSRGSSEVFRQMPALIRGERRVAPGDVERDPAAISFACREINEISYQPAFAAALDRLDFEVGTVADLGCGSGGRIMDMLRRFPGARGIGVDIARPSLAVAERDLAAAGLADRAVFRHGDVLRLDARPEFREADLVTCFMMGHDFWPRERAVATLRRLRRVFPAARRLLIGDATRTVGVADRDLPVFTLGFELGHELMGDYLPALEDWQPVFAEAGWDLRRTEHIDLTVGEVIFELA